MRSINWNLLYKQAKKKISDNGPSILTAAGIAGMFAAGILAVKATPKAMEKIEQKKKEDHHKELTAVQTVQAAGPCYIPAVTTAIASAVCLIEANSEHGRRNAALATACGITENAFREYRSKVVEQIGEAQENVILEAIDRDRIQKNPPPDDYPEPTHISGGKDELCCDSFGRYFYSTREEIESTINQINWGMNRGDMYISLNDVSERLGIDCSADEVGDRLGWNVAKGLIEVHFSTVLVDGRKPCLAVHYRNAPYYDYDMIS